jgi:hypothetical protein
LETAAASALCPNNMYFAGGQEAVFQGVTIGIC